MDKHLKIWQYAKLAQSKMRCLYKWCVAEKKATHLPLPYEDCSEWMTRLVKHLTTHKVFDLTNKIVQRRSSKIDNSLEEMLPNRREIVGSNPTGSTFFEILAKLCVSLIIHSHLQNAKCFCFLVL